MMEIDTKGPLQESDEPQAFEALLYEGVQQAYALNGLARVVGKAETRPETLDGERSGDEADLDIKYQEELKGVRDVVDGEADYLRNIGNTPLLSAEQEVTLAKAIEAGVLAREALSAYGEGEGAEERRSELEKLVEEGEAAYEAFICANLRLVVSVAKRYTGRGVPFLDLIQEGNLGLIRAVEKFDYKKGNKFSTYATWWLKQSMSRAIVTAPRMIHVPMHIAEKNNVIARTEKYLQTRLGRPPSDKELQAEDTTITKGELEAFRTTRQSEPFSLDALVNEDTTFGDLLRMGESESPTEEVAVMATARTAIHRAVALLQPIESQVLTMHLGLDGKAPMSQEAIGRELGMPIGRVRDTRLKALSKLRHPSRAHELRAFLHQ